VIKPPEPSFEELFPSLGSGSDTAKPKPKQAVSMWGNKKSFVDVLDEEVVVDVVANDGDDLLEKLN